MGTEQDTRAADTTVPHPDDVALTADSVITRQAVRTDRGEQDEIRVDGTIVAVFPGLLSDKLAAFVDRLHHRRGRLASQIARKEYVQGLRDLADFLEAHPEVPRPLTKALGRRYDGLNLAKVMPPERFTSLVETLDARIVPSHTPGMISAIKNFGPVELYIQVPRALVAEERPVQAVELVLPDTLAARAIAA
jgi:hypothetical protein